MAEAHTPLILLPASCAEQMREIYMQQKVPQGNSEFELYYTSRNSCKMGTKLNRLITNLLSHEGWLGVMVSLLDTVASTHVFGSKGTPGRPRGCITLTRLDSMADDKQLDEAQHLRWMQFLQVWQNAGWYDIAVITTAEELRSLQYGHFDKLCQHMDIITSHQMLAVIAKYANSRGQRRFCIKDYLISFLNVVQQFFSSPSKVLLEAPDVHQRLHKVQVMCLTQQ